MPSSELAFVLPYLITCRRSVDPRTHFQAWSYGYLGTNAEADLADADEEATLFLIRCEAMPDRMQNRHSSAADADDQSRARCWES